MKIALVCERFEESGGGLEQWARQVARRLVLRGHEVHVLAFRASVPPEPGWPRVHTAPLSDSRLERAEELERRLPRLGCDVIHDLGAGWQCDILHPQMGSREANLRGDWRSRTVWERWLDALRPGQRLWLKEVRELERRQHGRAGLTIAVSAMVARDLQKLHGVPAERIRVIPNGVDTERFSPQQTARLRDAARRRLGMPGETIYLFTAHNPRLKGIRPLLAAMRRLRQRCQEARLVVIGKDPEERHLRLAARLGLERSVRFAGLVEDALPYFAAADAFVLPTYYDACSLSALEALACGVPAVTTRCNGASELLTNGREGFVVSDPDDTAAFADAMAELTDPGRRRRMGEAARALALRCDLEHNVTEIEKVYREAAAARSAGIGAL